MEGGGGAGSRVGCGSRCRGRRGVRECGVGGVGCRG